MKNQLNILLLITLIFISGCKKNNEEDSSDSTDSGAELVTAEDNNRGESESNSIFSMSKGGLDRKLGAKTDAGDTLNLPPCATETLDTLSTPRTYTIDFGTTNCLCWDGKNRRGKTIITWSGNMRDSLAVMTITTDSLWVDDVRWLYTHRETNLGRIPPQGNPARLIEVTDCKIFGSEGTVEFTSSRTREHTQGHWTPMDMRDDEFLIRGTTSGKDRNGNTFNTEILMPLKFRTDCKYFSAGSMELRRNGGEVRRLEYGDGNCDNDAVMIIKGKPYPFKLK